ncbi:MAG: CHC2 zinc finger domain-containing protein [Solirubrobacterales bacterium]
MQTQDIRRYLAALYRDAPPDSLMELRFRCRNGMRQAFHPAAQLDQVCADIDRNAALTDVYIGVLPRCRRSGGREDLVAQASLLWADCDTPQAIASLRDFTPAPNIVLTSGTARNLHAYWLLSHPVALDVIETTNRRLAHVLAADASCADPARVLRPPSLNHKHHPPAAVRLKRCNAKKRHRLSDITASLPDNIDNMQVRNRGPRPQTDDPLLLIPPVVYVEHLAGIQVPRSGKIACPFHQDRTPSLHVYREPERGWYCYGCQRGGSVYDFAAQLWQLQPFGPSFRQLRQQLSVALLAGRSA